nr:class I SAM-dependent methyltransferase [Helicobacter colisuis]
MGGAIKIIKDKICNYINKDSVCLEVAPGSGDMLNALIQDVKFYYTVDPSLVSLEIEGAANLQHIQGFFNYQEIKDKIKHKVDFILFRHLLEHINTPLSFLKEVASLLHDDGVAYIEVPNFSEIVNHNRFYEITNDHCGYYQENVLINTMSKLGFELTEIIILFREQHMGLFFKKSSNHKNSYPLDFKRFDNTLEKKFNKTKNYLETLLESYKEIAIYGAGGHGNSLANYLENPKNIKRCFDLDARKQGKYLQNSNILIQEPNEVNFDNIECIIIASPLYEKEIIDSLRQKGFTGDIIATEKELMFAKFPPPPPRAYLSFYHISILLFPKIFSNDTKKTKNPLHTR